MANAHTLTPDHQKALAVHLSRHPVSSALRGRQRHRRIAEHFEFWQFLNVDAPDTHVRLEVLCTQTGIIHHQIKSADTAVQYALSRLPQGEAGEIEVLALCTSPLARRIDEVISWIDHNLDDRNEHARLLFVPSRMVYAIWLCSAVEDRLVMISKPNMGGTLRYGRVHPRDVFLRALRRRQMKKP